MKGDARPGGALVNQFKLEIDGLPPIFYTYIGSLEMKAGKSKMADQTWQPTGETEPGETTVRQYVHHEDELQAMEGMFREWRNGGANAKRDGTLDLLGADQQPVVSWEISGWAVVGRSIPDLERKDIDADSVEVTWNICYDSIELL